MLLIARMLNGSCLNHAFQQCNPVVVHVSEVCAKLLTPSSTTSALAVLGVHCRMSFRLGKRYILTFALGVWLVWAKRQMYGRANLELLAKRFIMAA